jgi:hypothetical protein
MAFDINEIRNQLTFGGARASLFEVSITNPVNTTADSKISFMGRASSLPASNLGTINVPYFGRQVKFAGNRTFEQWAVTVVNDEDFLVRNALEDWMSSINTHEGNINAIGGGVPALGGNYKSQAQVNQYSKSGSILRGYNFNGLFPVSLSAITLDWDSEEIQTFEVQFEYDWWNVSTGITGDAGTNV